MWHEPNCHQYHDYLQNNNYVVDEHRIGMPYPLVIRAENLVILDHESQSHTKINERARTWFTQVNCNLKEHRHFLAMHLASPALGACLQIGKGS
jgi:hypothetical protein